MSEHHLFDNLLFRYRPNNDNSIDAFKNDRLYFSAPVHFNDPFDCVMHINQEMLISSILRDLDTGMEDFISAKAQAPLSIVTPENKEFFLRSFDSPKLKNDFLRGVIAEIEEIKKNILDNSRIICFSKEHLSILMWSHYANYHKGFALAYSKDNLKNATAFDANNNILSSCLRLGAVRYQTNMPDCGAFFYEYFPKKLMGHPHFDHTGFFTQLMYNKTQEWTYEEEWRLCSVPDDYSQIDHAHYISVRPAAIFLGSKMSNKQKWQLYSIAKKKDIAVFEVWANSQYSEFRLNFQVVNPKELKKLAQQE